MHGHQRDLASGCKILWTSHLGPLIQLRLYHCVAPPPREIYITAVLAVMMVMLPSHLAVVSLSNVQRKRHYYRQPLT